MLMKSVDIIIKNAMIYTVDKDDSIIDNGCIVINKDCIEAIGCADLLNMYQGKKVIDATGKVIFPGFVNTHIHIFQSLLKGLGADHRLIEWLNLSALPYGKIIDANLQYEAARLASMEAIKSGCTTLSEFFYTVQSDDLAHGVIRGMKDVGIRSVFIRTFCDTGSDYGMPDSFIETMPQAINNIDNLYNSYSKDDDMLKIWTGPCVTWSTTKNGYSSILEYCQDQNMPYSMHIQETDVDNEMSQKHYNMNAVDLLDSVGFLTKDFLAVHCVNLTEHEMQLFAENDVAISHNPMPNLYLGSGFAPIPECLERNIRVSLGTDGAASNNTTNMLETMKMATVCQKAVHKDASILPAKQILRMATFEGAKAIQMDHLIGSLEVGKKADLIIFNPDDFTSFPMHDPLATLVYASTPFNIETTIINGQVVYEGREFTKGFDEQAFFSNITAELNKIKRNI
jgi:5-methylthioadenosine/S-adenosylhomocysteine deaminase